MRIKNIPSKAHFEETLTHRKWIVFEIENGIKHSLKVRLIGIEPMFSIFDVIAFLGETEDKRMVHGYVDFTHKTAGITIEEG